MIRRRNMSEKFDRLKQIMGEIADVGNAAALASWDQQTYMPAGGNQARGQQLATLGEIAHELGTSEELGKLLSDLQTEFAGDNSSDEAAMVRVALREYKKETCVPA